MQALFHGNTVACELKECCNIVDVAKARCYVGEYAAVVIEIQVVLPDIVQELFHRQCAVGKFLDEGELQDGVIYVFRSVPCFLAPFGVHVTMFL